MPASPLPQFAYPASGPTTTFVPTYPAVEKPGTDDLEGVYSKVFTVSGLRQLVSFRDDLFVRLTLKYVPHSELDDWTAFLSYALAGQSFLFYPDSLATAYDECWLEDAGGSTRNDQNQAMGSPAWSPNFAFRLTDEFELVVRKVPGGLSHP